MKPWGSTLSMSGKAVWGGGGGENKVRLSLGPAALPHLLPRRPSRPCPGGLTMPVSDVKMTISYKGASCWNKVSMPGRFLNLQPVASWKGSENSETLRPGGPCSPKRTKTQSRGIPGTRVLSPSLWLSEGFRSTRL